MHRCEKGFFSFIGGTGVWAQGQVLYHLSHTPSLMCLETDQSEEISDQSFQTLVHM
jgi:hypothetical protein